jgi:hypothetical protein
MPSDLITDDLLRQRCLAAIRKANPGIGDFAARSIYSAVAPLILEAAAKVANNTVSDDDGNAFAMWVRDDIVAAILSMSGETSGTAAPLAG